ncbi:MAG: hypothetical protein E7166_00445 [Firmicutes bacterium]|nr:hypothetical protein [Bacillota bacterium]
MKQAEINWEEKYKNLEQEFFKMQKEYEARLNRPVNDTSVDVIRKLDSIGYLLKNFIKRQDLLKFTEREEKLKRELEEIHNQRIYIDNDYSRYDER